MALPAVRWVPVRIATEVFNVQFSPIAMNLSFVAPIPHVCYRCTCKVPKRAHFCPNCHVPQPGIDSDSFVQNTLLIVLTFALLLAVGWALYEFFGLA